MSLIKYLVGRVISANYKIDQLKKELNLKNGSMMKDFMPIDSIPEKEKNRLGEIDFRKYYPIKFEIPRNTDDKSQRSGPSLGDQIPKKLIDWFEENMKDIKIQKKMKASGYPDAKVIIDDIPYAWEWKTKNIIKQDGARTVIGKIPNTRFRENWNDDEKKYHIVVYIDYDIKPDVKKLVDNVSISEIRLYEIEPEFPINTKFELSTTAKQLRKTRILNKHDRTPWNIEYEKHLNGENCKQLLEIYKRIGSPRDKNEKRIPRKSQLITHLVEYRAASKIQMQYVGMRYKKIDMSVKQKKYTWGVTTLYKDLETKAFFWREESNESK